MSVDTKVIRGAKKLTHRKKPINHRRTAQLPFSDGKFPREPSSSISDQEGPPSSPVLRRRRSRSGGSEDAKESTNAQQQIASSVSDKVSSFARISSRGSTIDGSLRERGTSTERKRNTIHQLQDQLFRDSTLEKANGQLIIHRKGVGVMRSLSKPNQAQFEKVSLAESSHVSKSMEELDQPTPETTTTATGSSSKGGKEVNRRASASRSRHRFVRNNSCELLSDGEPLAPPEQFQDDVPRKPRRVSPSLVSGQSPKSAKKSSSSSAQNNCRLSSRNSSPCSESTTSSLSKYKTRSSSPADTLEDSGVFSTDF